MNRNFEILSDFYAIRGVGKLSRSLVRPFIDMNASLSLRDVPAFFRCANEDVVAFDCSGVSRRYYERFEKISIMPMNYLSEEMTAGSNSLISICRNSISKNDVKLLKKCKNVFSAGEFTKNILGEFGIQSSIINPCTIRFNGNDNVEKICFNGRRRFCFMSVVDGADDYEIEEIISSYCKTFRKNDDVCLVVKTIPKKKNIFYYNMIVRRIDAIKSRFGNNVAPIIVFNRVLSDKEMAGFYLHADCFIKLHSSGFGLSFIEAFQSGLICIAPEFGDCRDFLNVSNSFIIKKTGEEKLKNRPDLEGTTYIKYDVSQMSDVMRYCYEECDKVKEKFNKERKLLLHSFYNYSTAHNLITRIK